MSPFFFRWAINQSHVFLLSPFFFRWANRAKNIKNKPKINEDPKDALLREFQEEIARLKANLDKKGGPRGKKKRRKQSIGPNGKNYCLFFLTWPLSYP